MELTFYAYAEDEYAESPLFFAKLPYLGTHHGTPAGCVICASILRKLDELYGDLPTETSRWSLEYQLWTRMLLTEGAVMLNPMHLALYEDEHTFNSLVFCDDALEVSGDAIVWKKASGAPSNKITEAWEKETEKSGCNDTFTCAI